MAVAAYVIIECSVEPAKVVKEIVRLEGVKQAHALFGLIEAIAYVEAPDLKALDDVIGSLYGVEGVKGTDTRIARAME
jgi:hypothetical protein